MKVVLISMIFIVVHLVEDLMWLVLGRYTDIPFVLVLIMFITLGIIGGVLVRHPKAKKILGH